MESGEEDKEHQIELGSQISTFNYRISYIYDPQNFNQSHLLLFTTSLNFLVHQNKSHCYLNQKNGHIKSTNALQPPASSPEIPT
jgi:hypothetical protein